VQYCLPPLRELDQDEVGSRRFFIGISPVVKTFTGFDETETERNQCGRVFGSFKLLFGNFPP